MTLILSFYFLALNGLPCSDIEITNNSKLEVVSTSNLDHNHTAPDLCPPFCTCHCCHVHIIDFGSINFKPITKEISSIVYLHFNGTVEDHVYSLLDPPRV